MAENPTTQKADEGEKHGFSALRREFTPFAELSESIERARKGLDIFL